MLQRGSLKTAVDERLTKVDVFIGTVVVIKVIKSRSASTDSAVLICVADCCLLVRYSVTQKQLMATLMIHIQRNISCGRENYWHQPFFPRTYSR